MDEARVQWAEEFLREAVYRSRAAQAVTTLFKQGAAPKVGQCGLGERAAVVLELDAKGRELFGRLWTGELGDAELARIREVMRAWIEEQDAFDRERNHFLKAFRKENGFDRAGYALEVRERFERGLEEIGRGEDLARREKAEVLASIGSAGGG